MSAFEFVFTFYSVMLGLAAANVATGFADMWRDRRAVEVGVCAPLLAVIVLVGTMNLWLLQGVEGRLDAAELTINGVRPHASAEGEVPSLPGAKGALDNEVLTLPAAAAAFVCMG